MEPWELYFKEALRHWDFSIVISPYDKEELYQAFKGRLLDELKDELPKLMVKVIKDGI